ncbi:MAG: hypothetical protein DCC67_01000 [Planctomycetota bacterium]|nr:MAG: hypothetical protein DCC67_01000 [Planctomycetota bacterium]
MLSALAGGTANAAAGDPRAASTSAEARDDARRQVPLDRIDAKYRQAVADVLADPTLFRRMPTNVVDCRPELFTFLAQNPEVLVEIWRSLGVSQVELTRIDDASFRMSDGAGTTGTLVIVEQSCDAAAQNRIVMFADGRYEGKPFAAPISAHCVVMLRSGSVRETNGRYYVAARLDSFVKFDRTSLEVVAKAVHPFVGQTADRNFADTLAFVSNLSYTAEKRPEAIDQLAKDMQNVDEPRRRQLVQLARQCAEAGRLWRLSRAESASADAPARR